MIHINLRNQCLKILEEEYNTKLYINEILEGYFNMLTLESHEKAFINRVVYGTVENKIKLDYIINLFSNTKTDKLKLPILILLRMSIYQMLYMDNIPHSAIIDEAVKLVKKRKMTNLSGFLNGVLRNISRNLSSIQYPCESDQPHEFLSVNYSFPEWLVDYLLEQYSYDTIKAILEDSLKTPKVCIRHNALKGSFETLKNALLSDGIKPLPGHLLPYALYLEGTGNIRELKSFQEGLFQIQDESSMLVGEVAEPKEGDLVLDVCSAPGGKSTHLAQLMNNKGTIYARDLSERKLKRIAENCERLGITNIQLSRFDATQVDDRLIDKVDLVLTDVPCSGLGIIKKKPDIKYNVTPEGIDSLIKIQRSILEASSHYVKKGGYLIYSTCTINKNENDKNVQWFLEQNPKFEKVPLEFKDININNEGFLQILPINELADGFFIAKLRRMT